MKLLGTLLGLMMCVEGVVAVLRPKTWTTLGLAFAGLFPGATHRYLESVVDATDEYSKASPKGLAVLAALEVVIGYCMVKASRSK